MSHPRAYDSLVSACRKWALLSNKKLLGNSYLGLKLIESARSVREKVSVRVLTQESSPGEGQKEQGLS